MSETEKDVFYASPAHDELPGTAIEPVKQKHSCMVDDSNITFCLFAIYLLKHAGAFV
jgi:hypothetical protein